jgi:hypothetical protein
MKAMSKKPDKLAQDVAKATAANMSYGRWKAMQPPVKPVKEEKIPEGWKKCEYCGKLFKTRGSKRFCEVECREKAYLPRMNEKAMLRMRKYRERNGWKDGK